MDDPRCRCRCHATDTSGDIVTRWGVDLNDALEGALACPSCQAKHYGYLPPQPWSKTRDQADGSETLGTPEE